MFLAFDTNTFVHYNLLFQCYSGQHAVLTAPAKETASRGGRREFLHHQLFGISQGTIWFHYRSAYRNWFLFLILIHRDSTKTYWNVNFFPPTIRGTIWFHYRSAYWNWFLLLIIINRYSTITYWNVNLYATNYSGNNMIPLSLRILKLVLATNNN